MLFDLNFVPNHPVYRLQEAIDYFFANGLRQQSYNVNCVPTWFRPVVGELPSLDQRLRRLFRLLKQETPASQSKLLRAWTNNNSVQALCEDKALKIGCFLCSSSALRKQLRGLFEYLYDEGLDAKAFIAAAGNKTFLDHYHAFRKINAAVCPFCGIENYVDRTDRLRSTYDHYLPRSRYFFSSVNFQNLVPMCDRCNERPSKGTTDPLLGRNGKRRRVFYPYASCRGIRLSVSCIQRPALGDGGKWKVVVKPANSKDSESVQTWKSLFRFPHRYETRLEERNSVWIRDLLASSKPSQLRTPTNLRAAFRKEARKLKNPYFVTSKSEAVLQGAFFSYLGSAADVTILKGITSAADGVPKLSKLK